jgi:hypothetical protein
VKSNPSGYNRPGPAEQAAEMPYVQAASKEQDLICDHCSLVAFGLYIALSIFFVGPSVDFHHGDRGFLLMFFDAGRLKHTIAA